MVESYSSDSFDVRMAYGNYTHTRADTTLSGNSFDQSLSLFSSVAQHLWETIEVVCYGKTLD